MHLWIRGRQYSLLSPFRCPPAPLVVPTRLRRCPSEPRILPFFLCDPGRRRLRLVPFSLLLLNSPRNRPGFRHGECGDENRLCTPFLITPPLEARPFSDFAISPVHGDSGRPARPCYPLIRPLSTLPSSLLTASAVAGPAVGRECAQSARPGRSAQRPADDPAAAHLPPGE